MGSKSEVIKRLVRGIVDNVHPQKIILFGSAARDEASHNNDIDVLVVMPEGVHRRHIAQSLYR